MARPALGSVVQQLGALFEGGSAAGLSDRQLLERYNAGGRDSAGEAAFAALVGRHGPMVLGICRQILGDVQHAEDVFQAVFLVLAQKARSIRDPDLLGNWLYGVAIRMARRARQQVARRRRAEGDTMSVSGMGTCATAGPTADRPAIDREQAEALHGEIARLPRAFRLPVVLFYFEGLTLDEAARRLRCPAGTVHSRLARARVEAAPRTHPSRRGPVLSRTGHGPGLSLRLGVHLIIPVSDHDQGRDQLRGWTGLRRGPLGLRGGPHSGDAPFHVAQSVETHRVVLGGPGRRRRGVPELSGGRASLCGPGCSADSGSCEVARPGSESDPENGRWRR